MSARHPLPGSAHPGVGLSYRRQLHVDILEHAHEIDFLEVIAERYSAPSSVDLQTVAELSSRFALVPHGVSLSVGTAGSVSPRTLSSMKAVCELLRAPFYSDHLALSAVPGLDIGHLSPMPYDRDALLNATSRIHRVQDAIGLPFVVENITETHAVAGSTLGLPEFLHALVDATGCGVLLDVTNLYINSVNFGFDATAAALAMPLDAVVQIHLAGGQWRRGKLMDTHSSRIPDAVWQLYERLVPMLPNLQGVVIERDADYPPFSELLDELARARKALHEASRVRVAGHAGGFNGISETSEMCATDLIGETSLS